jgi:hypothetical protein
MKYLMLIKDWFDDLIYRIKARYRYKKRMKQIKKRDPYIYK